MTNQEGEWPLEEIMDHRTLSSLLDDLSRICHEKANHIDATYQSIGLANDWRKAADAIDKAVFKIHKMGL